MLRGLQADQGRPVLPGDPGATAQGGGQPFNLHPLLSGVAAEVTMTSDLAALASGSAGYGEEEEEAEEASRSSSSIYLDSKERSLLRAASGGSTSAPLSVGQE